MKKWQAQDAKSRFSEVIHRAEVEGPQVITRHGAERAVILSIADYRALAAYKPDFKAHLLGGPKVDDFSVERPPDTGRAVEIRSCPQAFCRTPTSYPSRARCWGELSAAGGLPVIDTLIAATALQYGLTLVTRNTRDVVSTGVSLLDPWQMR